MIGQYEQRRTQAETDMLKTRLRLNKYISDNDILLFSRRLGRSTDKVRKWFYDLDVCSSNSFFDSDVHLEHLNKLPINYLTFWKSKLLLKTRMENLTIKFSPKVVELFANRNIEYMILFVQVVLNSFGMRNVWRRHLSSGGWCTTLGLVILMEKVGIVRNARNLNETFFLNV